ncbi:MAG: hypothetical protein ACJAS1_006548, partial [Oleiphilaceae bacterium]
RFVLKAVLSYGAATDRFTTESSQSKRSSPKQKRTLGGAMQRCTLPLVKWIFCRDDIG